MHSSTNRGARDRRTPVRKVVRAAGVVALATAAVLGVGGAAQAATVAQWDLDGDGWADQYGWDTPELPGTVTRWCTDRDHDDVCDELALDAGGDGHPDLWWTDTDLDHVWDVLSFDNDRDTLPDPVGLSLAPLPGTATTTTTSTAGTGQGCLNADGTLPVNIPVYGPCAWLQGYAQTHGIGPDPGSVIADSIRIAGLPLS